MPDFTATQSKPGTHETGHGAEVRPDDVIRRAHEAFIAADVVTSAARVSKLVRRALRYRTPADLIHEVDALVAHESARCALVTPDQGRPTLNVGSRGGIRGQDPTGEAAIWRTLLGGGA